MHLNASEAIAAIVELGKQLDALRAMSSQPTYIPVPAWLEEVAKQCIANNKALARFKRNSSYWPEQFPWYRNQHHDKSFLRVPLPPHEYRPVFST